MWAMWLLLLWQADYYGWTGRHGLLLAKVGFQVLLFAKAVGPLVDRTRSQSSWLQSPGDPFPSAAPLVGRVWYQGGWLWGHGS